MSAHSRALRAAKKAMQAADRYEGWLAAAEDVDRLTGLAEWRAEDTSPHYDAQALRDDLQLFERLQREGDVAGLVDALHETLHRNLNDVLEPELYTTANAGTKHLVTRWFEAVEGVINGLAKIDAPGWSTERKRAVVQAASRNLGRSALLLSGGATLGFYHLGVVRAMWQAGYLPDVIVGASMGAMVAAGICGRTDAELDTLFAPDTPELNTFGLEWRTIGEAIRTKTLMRPERLLEVIHHNCGEYTFAEAHARSGRELGISLMPTRARQKPRLLSQLTAPQVWIPTAALASAAVPGLFPPVALNQRTPDGDLVPYVAGETWTDGSFGGDLPRERVGRLHNVNHFIVSQTQPHMLPVMAGVNQRGLVRLATKAAVSAARAQGLQALSLTRKLTAGTPLKAGFNLAHAVIQQDYSGDIDIYPRFDVRVYGKLLSNPTKKDLGWFVSEGERATWPKLSMIRDATRISRCLSRCEAAL